MKYWLKIYTLLILDLFAEIIYYRVLIYIFGHRLLILDNSNLNYIIYLIRNCIALEKMAVELNLSHNIDCHWSGVSAGGLWPDDRSKLICIIRATAIKINQLWDREWPLRSQIGATH